MPVWHTIGATNRPMQRSRILTFLTKHMQAAEQRWPCRQMRVCKGPSHQGLLLAMTKPGTACSTSVGRPQA